MPFTVRKLVGALLCGTAIFAGVAVGQNTPEAPPPAAAGGEACAKLAGLKLQSVENLSIGFQPAKAPVEGARMPSIPGLPEGAPIAGLPAFCRVSGNIRPEPGSDIRFEVWLPTQDWNGRFLGAGVGGFAGSIPYVDLASAVRAGFATAGTDTGHTGDGMDSSWAKGHPARVRDYSWRAIHLTTVAAKTVLDRYYGRSQDHAYFMSCSGGGRQALIEASRFPEDYDGIMAGAPAAVFTDHAISMAWTVQAQQAAGAAIRPEQVSLLQGEVLKQCDATDGLADGVVTDPRKCVFDVAALACGAADSPLCFTPPQLSALEKIYTGPRDAEGNRIGGVYLATGAEKGNPLPFFGWEGWVAAGQDRATPHFAFSNGLFNDLVAVPVADPQSFDFTRDPANLKAQLGPELDAKPELQRFFDRGGKLILWHGWADAALAPELTIDFYEAALRNSGSRAGDSMRLFMIPGMQHCFGGTGPVIFGTQAPMPGEAPEHSLSAALQAWVETGRAPDSLVGRMSSGAQMPGGAASANDSPVSERLICAYPQQPALQAGANPDQAASYVCKD